MGTKDALEAKTPIGAMQPKLTHKEIVEGLRALRKRVKPGKSSVREMVAEGRRQPKKPGEGSSPVPLLQPPDLEVPEPRFVVVVLERDL